MFDLLDFVLLRRGLAADDRTLSFRRIDGRPSSKVIYFLPWNTPFVLARQAGFLPLDFLAAYEMPPAIISSEPSLCVQAMRALVADAETLLADRGVDSVEALIVGLSIGSYPATYLANRIGARLCSVAGSDRGDLMLWESPAGHIVKQRAISKGYELADFSEALAGYHPCDNLSGIGRDSLFVFGRNDPFIPPPRKAGLLQAIAREAQKADVIALDGGHIRTLRASGHHQLVMSDARRTAVRIGKAAVQCISRLPAALMPAAQ